MSIYDRLGFIWHFSIDYVLINLIENIKKKKVKWIPYQCGIFSFLISSLTEDCKINIALESLYLQWLELLELPHFILNHNLSPAFT